MPNLAASVMLGALVCPCLRGSGHEWQAAGQGVVLSQVTQLYNPQCGNASHRVGQGVWLPLCPQCYLSVHGVGGEAAQLLPESNFTMQLVAKLQL